MVPKFVKIILVMFVIGTIICVVFFMLMQTIVHELRSKHGPPTLKNESNVSLSSLLSDSLLDSWLHDSPKSTAWNGPHNSGPEGPLSEHERTIKGPNVTTEFSSNVYDIANTTYNSVQNDESTTAASKEYFVESLFNVPTTEVEPDWSVILGIFDHFADENWKNFLIQTEVPLLVRLFLSDSSETATISRIFKDGKKDTKGVDKKSINSKSETTPAEFELLIETSSWLLTHNSQFRLGEPYIEHDLDGTDSLNTFFFTSPRLLIHNKIKDKWRTAIIRHFDEKGLNMTFVDRDRVLIAQRFFNRID